MQTDIRSAPHSGAILRNVVDGTPYRAVDVFGPTMEFLSGPDDFGTQYCVMRGVVPAGVIVPLHSHEDAEDFFILSGAQQVLMPDEDRSLRWYDVSAGDYLHIPGGHPHAHRNVGDEPAIELVITTARLGRFFRDIARPAVDGARGLAPDDLAEFVVAATKYGYVLGTLEENAAVGIELGPL